VSVPKRQKGLKVRTSPPVKTYSVATMIPPTTLLTRRSFLQLGITVLHVIGWQLTIGGATQVMRGLRKITRQMITAAARRLCRSLAA
jgi:hypothetical protein